MTCVPAHYNADNSSLDMYIANSKTNCLQLHIEILFINMLKIAHSVQCTYAALCYHAQQQYYQQ